MTQQDDLLDVFSLQDGDDRAREELGTIVYILRFLTLAVAWEINEDGWVAGVEVCLAGLEGPEGGGAAPAVHEAEDGFTWMRFRKVISGVRDIDIGKGG